MVEVVPENGGRGSGRRGKCPDHEHSRARERGDSLPGQMPKPAFDLVPRHGGSHGLADHEPDLRTLDPGVHVEVEHQGSRAGPAPLAHGSGEEPARGEPVRPGQHGTSVPGRLRVNARGERSGGQTVATLATARRQDGAAGAGTHPQTETVRLVTAAVVRLERTLAHGLDLRFRGVERDIDLEPGLTAGAGQPVRLAPPAHGLSAVHPEMSDEAPWTCGTGRHRFDRPTVRGTRTQGQTEPGHQPRRSAHGAPRDTLGSPVDNRLIHRCRTC